MVSFYKVGDVLMKSRMDKYNNDSLSRSSKNKHLYEDLYTNTDYTNMVVIDDSNEIDISKIKEIIDNEKKDKKIPREAKLSTNIYENITPIEEPTSKVYDINQVLKEAKEKRDIIEEANEKRKREHYDFKANEQLEDELAKTRKVYENLIKEEKELLNIMNTLTNVSSADIALDLFEDLKPSDNEKTVGKNSDTAVNIKQIPNDDDSREYSTDTFMFNTKDFEGIDHFKNDVKKTNLFIKILIFALTVIIICISVFVIKKYLIK